ncbi:MAG: hypothetical protein ACHBN1_03675 [Heteroscytonema crispum UTEX LB 1556]
MGTKTNNADYAQTLGAAIQTKPACAGFDFFSDYPQKSVDEAPPKDTPPLYIDNHRK